MIKIFAILFLALSLNALTIKEGWNLIGVNNDTSSTSLILNENELIYSYDGNSWDYYTSNKSGTLEAGRGFWIKSSTTRNIDLTASNSNDISISNKWELISPVSTMDLSTNDKISYAWKYTGGQDSVGEWKLYHPTLSQNTFGTFTTAEIGEGVWIKSNNASIGNTSVYIKNGDFGTVSKTSSLAQTKEAFLEDIKNTYDISFDIDKQKSNLDLFMIGIKLTKLSTNSEYFYFVKVDTSNSKTLSSPQVDLQKSTGEGLGGALIPAPMLELTNNTLVLNFHKISKFLIDYNWYSLEDLKDRLSVKTDYKIELFTRNLEILNSSKTSSSLTLVNNLFPEGSNKIEGIISIK